MVRGDQAMAMAEIMENKLAEDVTVFDLRRLPYVTDYFVVGTGTSTPHVRAIADALEEAYPSPLHREVDAKEEWHLMDYGDVVIHIFQPAARAYYALERLWGDAPTKTTAPEKPTRPGRSAMRRKRSQRTRSDRSVSGGKGRRRTNTRASRTVKRASAKKFAKRLKS